MIGFSYLRADLVLAPLDVHQNPPQCMNQKYIYFRKTLSIWNPAPLGFFTTHNQPDEAILQKFAKRLVSCNAIVCDWVPHCLPIDLPLTLSRMKPAVRRRNDRNRIQRYDGNIILRYHNSMVTKHDNTIQRYTIQR